jgi:hypothetical protein
MLRKNLIVLIISALVVCILISGCKIFKPSGSTIPIDELLSASEQIEIDGRKYVLETYLWRDFMPISPPDSKPLIALIWITATDSLEFPASVDGNQLWIVNGQEIWETKFSDEELPEEPHRKHQLAKIARNGPKWGPGIQVNVVVQVIDGENNTYLLRASNQWIHRTD